MSSLFPYRISYIKLRKKKKTTPRIPSIECRLVQLIGIRKSTPPNDFVNSYKWMSLFSFLGSPSVIFAVLYYEKKYMCTRGICPGVCSGPALLT